MGFKPALTLTPHMFPPSHHTSPHHTTPTGDPFLRSGHSWANLNNTSIQFCLCFSYSLTHPPTTPNPQEVPFCISGRNWGSLDIHGKSLMFTVDGKVGFEVPLPDVSTATAQKDDVVMELHVDDTATHEREDTLAEITFTVPQSCEAWPVRDPDSGDVSAKVSHLGWRA